MDGWMDEWMDRLTAGIDSPIELSVHSEIIIRVSLFFNKCNRNRENLIGPRSSRNEAKMRQIARGSVKISKSSEVDGVENVIQWFV